MKESQITRVFFRERKLVETQSSWEFYLRAREWCRFSVQFSSLFIFDCCICIHFRRYWCLCCNRSQKIRFTCRCCWFFFIYLFYLASHLIRKLHMCAGRAMNLLEPLWAGLIGTGQCERWRLISCGRRKYDILLDRKWGEIGLMENQRFSFVYGLIRNCIRLCNEFIAKTFVGTW